MVKSKIRILKLKRFGKIEDRISCDFNDTYWKCKFGDDGRNSNFMVMLVYNKKEFTKEQLPKELKIQLGQKLDKTFTMELKENMYTDSETSILLN